MMRTGFLLLATVGVLGLAGCSPPASVESPKVETPVAPQPAQGGPAAYRGAAVAGQACPGDDEIARFFGSHSPGRARRLLGQMEQMALIVCRTDFQGRRIIAFPELEFETATEAAADFFLATRFTTADPSSSSSFRSGSGAVGRGPIRGSSRSKGNLSESKSSARGP